MGERDRDGMKGADNDPSTLTYCICDFKSVRSHRVLTRSTIAFNVLLSAGFVGGAWEGITSLHHVRPSYTIELDLSRPPRHPSGGVHLRQCDSV